MGELHNKIAEICRARGISVFKMCKDIGMQPSVMTDLKMGRTKSLSAKNLQKIAGYFNLPMEFFLGEKEAPAAESDERTVIDLSGLDEEQIAIAQEFMSLPPQKRAALVEFAKTLESGE